MDEEIDQIEENAPEVNWENKFTSLTKSQRGDSTKEETDVSEYVNFEMLGLLVKTFRNNRNEKNAPVKTQPIPIGEIGICFKDSFFDIGDVPVLRDIKRELKNYFVESDGVRILINKKRNEKYLKPNTIQLEDITHTPVKRQTKKGKK